MYEVSYLNGEDRNISEFFTDKNKANRAYEKLLKQQYVPVDFDDSTDVNTVFDIHVMDVEISKKGILSMLNSKFSE